MFGTCTVVCYITYTLLQKTVGVDTAVQRGRSSSLLDISHSHNGLRQQWCKAQGRRVSVDILSTSSALPEHVQANSAHVAAEQ